MRNLLLQACIIMFCEYEFAHAQQWTRHYAGPNGEKGKATIVRLSFPSTSGGHGGNGAPNKKSLENTILHILSRMGSERRNANQTPRNGNLITRPIYKHQHQAYHHTPITRPASIATQAEVIRNQAYQSAPKTQQSRISHNADIGRNTPITQPASPANNAGLSRNQAFHSSTKTRQERISNNAEVDRIFEKLPLPYFVKSHLALPSNQIQNSLKQIVTRWSNNDIPAETTQSRAMSMPRASLSRLLPTTETPVMTVVRPWQNTRKQMDHAESRSVTHPRDKNNKNSPSDFKQKPFDIRPPGFVEDNTKQVKVLKGKQTAKSEGPVVISISTKGPVVIPISTKGPVVIPISTTEAPDPPDLPDAPELPEEPFSTTTIPSTKTNYSG